jgi:uncharacterized protein YuzE
MDIEYDKDADAVYIKFQKGTVAKTKKINSTTLVDMDKNDEIVGLELLEASARLPQKSFLEVHVKNLQLMQAK